jgi:hypothetical protein
MHGWTVVGFALIVGPGSVAAIGTNVTELPALTIAPAVEISFPTQEDVVYVLQSSADLTNWTTLDVPFLGSIEGFKKTFSVNAQKRVFYRLQMLEPVPYVLPESLAGASLRLRFQPEGGELLLFSSATEAASDDGLTASYVWKQKERRIEIGWLDGWTALIQLQFNAAGPGSGRATVIYQERDRPPFIREGEFLFSELPVVIPEPDVP